MTVNQQGKRDTIQSSLRVRLQVTFIVFGILGILAVGGLTYSIARQNIVQDNFDTLIALRSTRAAELQRWFSYRRRDVQALAQNPYMVRAVRDFGAAVSGQTTDEATLLAQIQTLYTGQPGLADAGDGSAYSRVHAAYHPYFERYIAIYGYYDMHIVDVHGDILYTTIKEADFTTNLLDGQFSNSNLAVAFQYAVAAPDDEFTALTDFRFFEASQENAMFISAPIFADTTFIGALIVELPIDILNAILNQHEGLGETGETYAVGADKLFRNDSRFLDELGVASTVFNTDFPVDTLASQSALSGESASQIITDYRSVSVLSAWQPLALQEAIPNIGIDGVQWALIAEIDEAEVLQSTNQLLLTTVSVSIAAVAAIVIAANLLTRPIQQLARVAAFIRRGDLSQRAEVTSSDEIGQLAQALNQMVETIETRNRDVQAIVDVTTQIATVLDENRLLQDVSDLTKERFRLYHAHVYLLNKPGDTLKLTAGAGYVGRRMVAEERMIAMDNQQSIVAQTARTRQSSIVNDVRAAETFLPHPLLPETRSELAVALVARGQLLGVLDVQSDAVNFFSENMLVIIQTLAAQIANALSNARLYENSERTSRHAQALSTIQAQLQSANDIDEMLRTTAHELAKAVRVPYAAVELKLTEDSESNNHAESNSHQEEMN